MKKKELFKRIEVLEESIINVQSNVQHALDGLVKQIDENFDKAADEFNRLNQLQSGQTPRQTKELLIQAAEKFKAIADHANAINDVIQNAPKEETIYVPDGIIDCQGSIINNGHCLYFNDGSWEVQHLNDDEWVCKHNQFKLVPCKHEDLKAGDVAFVFLNEGNVDIKYEVSKLENYMIVTDKGLVYWDYCSGGISVVDYLNDCHVWYKVVEA